MKNVALALAACVSLAAFAPAAHAEETEAPPKTESSWYGYQTLSADGAALALGALAIASDGHGAQDGFSIASLLSYAVAPAIIHGVHGHAGKALGDLAIRLGAPAVGGLIGLVVAAAAWQPRAIASSGGALGTGIDGSIGAEITGFAVGAGIGIATAVVLDAALLSHETVAAQPSAPKPSALTVLPSAAPTKNGFSAGLTGTF